MLSVRDNCQMITGSNIYIYIYWIRCHIWWNFC